MPWDSKFQRLNFSSKVHLRFTRDFSYFFIRGISLLLLKWTRYETSLYYRTVPIFFIIESHVMTLWKYNFPEMKFKEISFQKNLTFSWKSFFRQSKRNHNEKYITYMKNILTYTLLWKSILFLDENFMNSIFFLIFQFHISLIID